MAKAEGRLKGELVKACADHEVALLDCVRRLSINSKRSDGEGQIGL